MSAKSKNKKSHNANTSELVAADLKAIVFLAEWGRKKDEHIKRTVKDRKRKRPLPPPTNNVIETEDGQQFRFLITDVDPDPNDPKVEIIEVTHKKLDPEKEQELLEAGDYPDESMSNPYLLLANDKASLRIAGGGWLEMRNQLLANGWDSLTADEVAYALLKLKERADQSLPIAFEVLVLVSVILCTGHSLKLALPLWVSSTPVTEDREGLGLILPEAGCPEWRVRALTLGYSEKMPKSFPGGRQPVGSFNLPDVAGCADIVRRLIADRNISLRDGEPLVLFDGNPDDYEKMIEAALKQIDPHGRITLHRIATFLFQRILDRVRDIATPAFITRNEHTLVSSKLFYSSFHVSYLRHVYKTVIEEICAELSDGGYPVSLYHAPPDESDDSSCVGSPLCPTLDTIRSATKRLKKDITRMLKRVAPDLKRLSNLMSFYVYLWFSCEIAARGVKCCFISDDELDALLKQVDCHHRTISHIDKSDPEGTHARLYSIGQALLNQIISFRKFRDSIDEKLFGGHSSGLPIYFISEQGDREVVRPKSLEKFLQEYLPFPPNFARHLLRSELVERYVMEGPPAGMAIEFLDALLGHWNLGEEPGGEFSTFPYRQYFAAVDNCIPPFAAGLGFKPMSTPRHEVQESRS